MFLNIFIFYVTTDYYIHAIYFTVGLLEIFEWFDPFSAISNHHIIYQIIYEYII